VPGRESALASVRPLKTWASAIDLDADIRHLLESRLDAMTRSSPTKRAITAAIAETHQSALSVSFLFDIAA
jgi:hypothetical protein